MSLGDRVRIYHYDQVNSERVGKKMKEPKIWSISQMALVLAFLKPTKCSIKGFKAAFKEESAFRSEIYLGLCLLPLSVVLAQSLNHWLVLFIPYLLLLIVELLNSSIEA